MRPSLLKPWFVFRPSQLIRRCVAQVVPPSRGFVPLRTAFGVDVIADANKIIGRSIRMTGIYDLAVSECIMRLARPGSSVIDAGANVGYMSIIASLAVGHSGRVFAFEPHPSLFNILLRNSEYVQTKGGGPVLCYQHALGRVAGVAALHVPPLFSSNDGVSRLSIAPSAESIAVQVRTLDDIVADDEIGVLKLDVEGFESEVLAGAEHLCRDGRVRHIIFEEHDMSSSTPGTMLRSFGFTIFALGASLRGPHLRSEFGPRACAAWEPQNFLATKDQEYAKDVISKRGWRVLTTGQR